MKKLFKGFSLIEMLLTLAIMSIVFLLTTKTLATIVKVSTITNYKTATRVEADFAMELMERFLSNSKIDDMNIYDTQECRIYIYDEEEDQMEMRISDSCTQAELDNQYSSPMNIGLTGNEVHIRLSGYDQLTCIAFFKEDPEEDSSKGYLLKRTVDFGDDNNPDECFEFASFSDPIIVLNAEEINVNDFKVSYAQSESSNNIFYVDLEMEPLFWAPGESNIERSVIRQSIVSTQGLTWY